MKPLSDSLRAAQQTAAIQPVVKVTASNRRRGVVRLDFVRLYDGTESEYHHGLAVAGDGSLIRVRLTPPAEGRRLFIQRVETPSPSSYFDSWTDSGRYNLVTCAAAACDDRVYIFWVRPDRRVEMLSGHDCGAAWDEVELVDYTPTTAINGLCAACKPNGDMALFIADQNTLYIKTRPADGQWQAMTAWDKTCGPLSGVAACYDGDWNLFITGQDPEGNYKLWSLVLGDGAELPAGEWSELFEIASAPAGGNFSYAHAFLARPDVLRAFYVEKHSGNEPWSRIYRADTLAGTSLRDNLWCEGVPLDTGAAFGVAVACYGGFCWLSSASGVWRATLEEECRELSAFVTALEQHNSIRGGALVVEMTAGADGGSAFPGAPAAGTEIEFRCGCRTSRGEELGEGWRYHVVSAGCEAAAGSKALTLRAADGWEDLRRWQARRLFRWNQQAEETSLRGILAFVLARAGLKLAVISASPGIDSLYPDFAVPAGLSGEAAVIRLLEMVADELLIESGTAYLIYPHEEDAPVYAYGGAHAILAATLRRQAGKVNAVQVEGLDAEGAALLAEGFDWQSAATLGERLRRVEDSNLEVVAEVQVRAVAVLGKEMRKADTGELVAAPNCAQQLYDVIDITTENLELNGGRRVVGWQLEYRPRRGRFRQRLLLGGL